MKRIIILISTFFSVQVIHSQHNMQQMNEKKDTITENTDSMPQMSHSFSVNLPAERNGSGTGWLPDASVMYGHGAHTERWMIMFHNNIFFRYNKQDLTDKGSRGGEKADVVSWFMLMGQRKIKSYGLFHFSTMVSLDPFTVGSKGYPLLFQTGETYQNKRLVDRQHPHDLFSELSLAYTQILTKNIDLTGYIAYPGEPALGPVAFMHRTSALNNPDAPLSHHWQDATHITFGVATFGIRFRQFKLEASRFTGREPDENRYDFDTPRFDSYSWRLSLNPGKQLALQVSQAFLKSPEALDPDENVKRTTASVIHHLPFKKENSYLSTSVIWGYNKSDHEENSFLLEPLLQLDKTAIYGRYEWLEKDAEELDLHQFINGEIQEFTIQALTLGANRIFIRKYGYNLAFGIQGSVFISDSRLESVYGKNPVSAEIYIRLYPHLMHMHNISNKHNHSQH
jgi:hypothetical protein